RAYEELIANLKPDEKVYFMDAVHPTHNSISAYGWIKTGTEKKIKANTGRQRLNINGVYSPMDNEIIIRDDKTINSESTI
ncbi:MAG: IS630 family transposase, partial [Spirochaetota bacterium]|nr:IS630 family transposase [Spirochaetota bacterium]